ncbi:hypothetical protein [Marinomonas sp.]|uniref:hypothetical protein n=1 Tax=Marinomonas sp. TaxID=1904862 RepID=UPI003A903655
MLKKIQTLLTHSITVLLVSVAGFAIGLLIAAMYSVPKVPMISMSFADIGGMLAGLASIGLLALAILTAKSWQDQINYKLKQDTLINLYVAVGNYLQSESQINLAIKDSKSCNSIKVHSEVDKLILYVAKVNACQALV